MDYMFHIVYHGNKEPLLHKKGFNFFQSSLCYFVWVLTIKIYRNIDSYGNRNQNKFLTEKTIVFKKAAKIQTKIKKIIKMKIYLFPS